MTYRACCASWPRRPGPRRPSTEDISAWDTGMSRMDYMSYVSAFNQDMAVGHL